MDVTTVKLHRRTKDALEKLKGENESYDDVISKLAEQTLGKNLRSELVEGYSSIGKEDLKILKDWEAASGEIDQ